MTEPLISRPGTRSEPTIRVSAAKLQRLWRALHESLAEWRSDWSSFVDHPQRPAIKDVETLVRSLPNDTVFEAFAVAFLSGNTRWDRVARVRGQLGIPFQHFDPGKFAALGEQAIVTEIVPWFRERRAGSAGLQAGLLRLRHTAAILAGLGPYESAADYLAAVYQAADACAEQTAMLIGASPVWKLPGFGIALAAEALRIIGFDLCKPDRHILRALGAWNLVTFARWDRKGDYTAPQARPKELLASMLAVRALAMANNVGVSYASSVIWLAGAVSGARLGNDEFAAIAGVGRT